MSKLYTPAKCKTLVTVNLPLAVILLLFMSSVSFARGEIRVENFEERFQTLEEGQFKDELRMLIKKSTIVPVECEIPFSERPSANYFRSHQKYNARPNCIDRRYGLDLGVIPFVKMGEYMITTFSRHSHIMSAGFGPCLAVTFYDRDTKTGMLAHVPASWLYDGPNANNPYFEEQSENDGYKKHYFDEIFQFLEKQGISTNRLEVGVYGGAVTRRNVSFSLKSFFESAGVAKIVFEGVADTIEKANEVARTGGLGSFKIFDLETGTLKSFRFDPYTDYFNGLLDDSGLAIFRRINEIKSKRLN